MSNQEDKPVVKVLSPERQETVNHIKEIQEYIKSNCTPEELQQVNELVQRMETMLRNYGTIAVFAVSIIGLGLQFKAED